ncbi:MAG: DDE-type integrase/transposase/recombinase [Proteobacteria bacterium]|nr:DDE-type integrase/transposase/recombinase [Desulfobacula sp.]MBU3952066.1 DDE-type integrase/transposase/recombinase [Pseudomonadota bacterium]MBU4132728.1 DDE-type integrase/transposase/recombinase [Pseudomonadota bacterium]
MNLVAESQISEAMDLGSQAVRLRAVKDNWPVVKTKKRGGNELFFVRDLLPLQVQESLVVREAVTGNLRISAVHEKPIPQKSKEVGLAKYNLVHAFRVSKQKAGWGQKGEAAKNFLLAYNAGLLLPNIFETLGEIKERTLDSLDKKLRDNDDNYLALCDGRGGWKIHGTNKYRTRKLSEQAKAVFLKCYLHASRPSVIMAVRAAWLTLEKAGSEEKPHETTFRRWLMDFEKYNAHVICLARDGMKAYQDLYGPYATRDAGLLEVGQCLVADGKTLNFFILHPVTGKPCRMKLIVFLDWASRYPVGWQIMPDEDSIAILAAFRNAVETLGKYPECVYLDNGKAFKAKVFTETDPDFEAMTGLYARVGTAVTFAKPYNGRAKVVERWFRTVQEQVEFMMPSYCGDSIITKPAWMHRNEKFQKAWHTARTNNWIPTIREAAHILDAYFNWYARQPHRELNGTPEEIFLPGRGPGIDPVQLNHDFLWRKDVLPHNCRITLWKIDYEADCLHNLSKKQKIIARYNTADLRTVWCYTKDGDYLGEAYPVQALHPMASLFGDEVSVAQVKDHNKRLARHKNEAIKQLEAMGVTKEAQDSLNILPFAQKVPVLPDANSQNNHNKKRSNSPEKLTEKEIKRLELVMEKAEAEKDILPEIPRPKFWSSDLEHYEWCFKLVHEHGREPGTADRQFMNEFELLPEFTNYRQRFEDLKLVYNFE